MKTEGQINSNKFTMVKLIDTKDATYGAGTTHRPEHMSLSPGFFLQIIQTFILIISFVLINKNVELQEEKQRKRTTRKQNIVNMKSKKTRCYK